MKLLSIFLIVMCLWATNINRHGAVVLCEVYPDENPTLISFSNGIVFDTRNGEPDLPGNFVIEGFEEAGHYMVQLTGPVYKNWTEELKQAGLTILGYLPKYTYLVYATNEQIAGIKEKSFVHWIGIFQPAYKIQKEVKDAKGSDRVVIQVFPDEDVNDIASQIRSMGLEIIEIIDHRLCKTIEVIIDPENVSDIAHIPGVLWMQLRTQGSFCNENCQWVTQTGWRSSVPSNPGARQVWFNGVVGNGVVLSTSDTGITTNHDQFYDSAYPISSPGTYPNHRKIVGYKLYQGATFGDTPNVGYHGSHVNCTVAGDDTLIGSSNYDGMAKKGKLYHVDIATSGGSFVLPTNLTAFYDTTYLGRGLPYNILQHSGSWGWGNSSGTYLVQDASTDAYVYENPDFLNLYAAGNESSTRRIRNPGISKNVLTIGALLNGTNSNQITPFSSRGPTQDNRIKPNIMAPGDGMTAYSGLWSANGATTSGYKQMAGTSMATPASNGAVGLIRQYLLAGFYPSGSANPSDSVKYQSAALLRAMAIVSCDPNVGSWNVPDFNIGWGRIDVDSVLYFSGDTRNLYIIDDITGVNTGQSITDSFLVNTAIPLRVCLAWTDTAAASGANPSLVNDLHLELVAPSGTWYRGNQYTSGQSSSNPSSWDDINVEECCRINNPETGVWQITVSGNSVPYGPQPFAFAITGDLTSNPGIAEDSRKISQSRITLTRSIITNKLSFEIVLKQATSLKVDIFDLAGRIVQNVVVQRMNEGSHRIDQKISLPSGVYFVNINAGDMQQIEKVLVIK